MLIIECLDLFRLLLKQFYVIGWLYNQLILTAGNIVGGFLFTGMAIYHKDIDRTKSIVNE